MRLVKNQEATHELLNRIRANYPERRAGIHVSDLIFCSRKAWYRLRSMGGVDGETDEATITFLLGRGYHEHLEGAEGGGEHQLELVFQPGVGNSGEPGSYEPIKVSGTMDAIEGWGLPIEFKTTRASSNKGPLESPHYVEQLASYCLATGATNGRLYILYINGNWKPPKPVMVCYDVVFTLEELADWRDEAERRAQVIVADTLPGLQEHYEWECGYCPFHKVVCEGGGGTRSGWFKANLTAPWELEA